MYFCFLTSEREAGRAPSRPRGGERWGRKAERARREQAAAAPERGWAGHGRTCGWRRLCPALHRVLACAPPPPRTPRQRPERRLCDLQDPVTSPWRGSVESGEGHGIRTRKRWAPSPTSQLMCPFSPWLWLRLFSEPRFPHLYCRRKERSPCRAGMGLHRGTDCALPGSAQDKRVPPHGGQDRANPATRRLWAAPPLHTAAFLPKADWGQGEGVVPCTGASRGAPGFLGPPFLGPPSPAPRGARAPGAGRGAAHVTGGGERGGG